MDTERKDYTYMVLFSRRPWSPSLVDDWMITELTWVKVGSHYMCGGRTSLKTFIWDLKI
jgi:hypothetical protein